MFNSFWRMLTRTLRPSRPAGSAATRRPARLALEALEDRWMPNATSIAGFVFNDANNNGIMDKSEVGLANSMVELHRADGSLVATATSDAAGHYVFNNDPTINVAPQSKEVDAVFITQPTDWSNSQSIAQFDPSLGTLTSVQIISTGNLTTQVQIENAAPPPSMTSQSSTASVQIVGQFTLTANGFGTLVQSATGAIDNQAVLGPWDGASDFSGGDSHDFGPKSATANGSATFSAGSQDLSAFIGTGSIQLNESAAVSSTDSGSGNFDQRIRSQADGAVRIIYNYIPSTGLKPGDYFVQQTTEPPDFFDGQTTNDNLQPIPNSYGVNRIDVHLDSINSSLTNNFGEVPPSTIAGYVYYDENSSGAKDAGEAGLGGVTLTLTGTNGMGQAVNISTKTQKDGSYLFEHLWLSGDYTITEVAPPPGGFLAPTVTVGDLGGAIVGPAVAHINLGAGVNGQNNNFGHVLPSSVAGFVYVDPNNNGLKETGEAGLANVAVTLTGTDYVGNQVFQTMNTLGDGSYSFSVAPGWYTISKAPPAGYINGIDTPGSLGGTTANDQLFVTIGQNKHGINYNFGELLPQAPPLPPPPPPPPIVPHLDPEPPLPPPPPPIDFGKWFFLS